MINKDLGLVTAYAYAVSKGYTGTEDEFAELMASYASVAEQAEESAEDSEAWAIGKRGGQDVPSTDATYHNNSKYYADQAGTSASTAASSASAASASESNAAASASSAAGSASSATTSAATATEKAGEASTSATAASTSAASAAGSATNAASSATAASASATAAGNAQTAAETAQGKAEDAAVAAEQAQSDAEAAAQSVSQSAAQISQNTSDISDLKSAVNDPVTGLDTKAPVIIDTASGAIASFEDGADGMPIKSLTVNVEPVQDLHGYDNPWPAGGGKNLLNPTLNTTSKDGVTITKNGDGTYTLNGSAGRDTYFNFAVNIPIDIGETYKITCSPDPSSSTYRVYGENGLTNYENSTGVATTNVCSITLVVKSGFTANNILLKPMLTKDTSATYNDFVPYSNICPISGWTGCNVTRTGKNLAKPYQYTSQTGNVTFAYDGKGSVTLNGTATASNSVPAISTAISNGFTFSLAAGTYMPSLSDTGAYVEVYDLEIGARLSNGNAFTISNETNVLIRVSEIIGTVYDNKKYYIQLERGSTATSYEPYQGTVYPITFPTSAGAIYDGTLTFNADGSVELRKRPYYESYNGETLVGPWISSMDVYSPGTTPTIGAQVVDMGGAETIYDLTAVPEIDTLFGTNNIWANCGPVDVDYPADTKLFIQKVNAPTDDDMTADTQIASGKYFLINNTLYLSTTVIPAGDAIIPGTNCQKTNLAAALNALNT